MDVRPGWKDSPQTPERQAASSVALAEILCPLSHGLFWEGLSESQQSGREWRAESESQENCGVSHWVMPKFPWPHGCLVTGWLLTGCLVTGWLVTGAVHRAECWEADPSWRKETECPPDSQWTD